MLNRLFLLSLVYVSITSCTRQFKKNTIDNSTLTNFSSDTVSSVKVSKATMANPVLMDYGADIGTIFSTYYKVGSIEKMIPFLDKKTKQAYSLIELKKALSKLQLGYDIKLTGMKDSADVKLLSYSCQINATTIIKRLLVVVENDTARIVPSNLNKGNIFQ